MAARVRQAAAQREIALPLTLGTCSERIVRLLDVRYAPIVTKFCGARNVAMCRQPVIRLYAMRVSKQKICVGFDYRAHRYMCENLLAMSFEVFVCGMLPL